MEKLNKQVSGPYNSVANVLPTSCIYKSIFLTGGGGTSTRLFANCARCTQYEVGNGVFKVETGRAE